LKSFDDEFEDVIYPNDEDFFVENGPNASWFQFKIKTETKRFSIFGEFKTGFTNGKILYGSLDNEDTKEVSFNFNFIANTVNFGEVQGNGHAKMLSDKLDVELTYDIGFQKLFYKYECKQNIFK